MLGLTYIHLCMHAELCLTSAMSDSLQPYGLKPVRLLSLWNSLGKNTGVGHHALLQGIFLTQGLNLGLLYYRHILLSHWGSPAIYTLLCVKQIASGNL